MFGQPGAARRHAVRGFLGVYTRLVCCRCKVKAATASKVITRYNVHGMNEYISGVSKVMPAGTRCNHTSPSGLFEK